MTLPRHAVRPRIAIAMLLHGSLCIACSLVVRPQDGLADERLKNLACRSVHLGYPAEDVSVFMNEVVVRDSAPGTYFMVCGWNTGYFGMQELANGKKLVLFSVWDSAKGNDPNAVAEELRVGIRDQHPDVRVKRFGGEGTGGQCFYDFEWKVGDAYRFAVAAKPAGDRTEYTGYFFDVEQSEWIKLVTFSTLTDSKRMRGLYSFVEDFKRDGKSQTQVRRAEFGNGWILRASQDTSNAMTWTALTTARFTADSNPVKNIDAGVAGARFSLATGGETKNTTTQLRELIRLEQTISPEPPLPRPPIPNAPLGTH